MVIQIARSEEEALSACRLTLSREQNSLPGGAGLIWGPTSQPQKEHSIQERGQRSGAGQTSEPGRPGVGNRCSEGTRCCVTGVAEARRLLSTGESAPGGQGPDVPRAVRAASGEASLLPHSRHPRVPT